jgi:hypothetical protein
VGVFQVAVILASDDSVPSFSCVTWPGLRSAASRMDANKAYLCPEGPRFSAFVPYSPLMNSTSRAALSGAEPS